MSKSRVTVVLDAQAGSCGKGKFIGYLAGKEKPDAAINNFMTNAGHTYVTDDGRKIMTQHLPTSMVSPETTLCIGPGAAITLATLAKEIYEYRSLIGNREIVIHPRAMVILPKHVQIEKDTIRSGSTFKGCGAAQAEKIMRAPGVKLIADCAKEWYDAVWEVVPAEYHYYVHKRIMVYDTAKVLNNIIDRGGDVMIEGSQGFDLDINYGLDYPHTTSRQCHVGQLIADCGISPTFVTDVVMTMRPYPIRISNQTNIGIQVSSGDYNGSQEISWEEVRKRCGAPADIEFGEFTTVTKRLRRVFELNLERLKYAVMINRPTEIALNFAQYIDWGILGRSGSAILSDEVARFVCNIERETGVSVTMVGTGSHNHEVIDLAPVLHM